MRKLIVIGDLTRDVYQRDLRCKRKKWEYMSFIRKVYLKLAILVHPDKVINNILTIDEEYVKVLSRAFNVENTFSEQTNI